MRTAGLVVAARSPGSRQRLLLAACLAGLLSACGGSHTEPATSTFDPVPHPDLTGTSSQAQAELAAARTELERRLAFDDPDPSELAAAFLSAAELYHAYGLLDAALVCYRNAVALEPDSHRGHYLLGVVASQRGDLASAAQHFERALELRPGDPAALLNLADLRLLEGQTKAAHDLYLRARDAGETAAALVGLGEVALATADVHAAVELLDQALQRAPEATRIHTLLAGAYSQLGDEEQARRHLALQGPAEVSIRDPVISAVLARAGGPGPLLRQGDAAVLAGHLDEAIAAYRRATELDPESAEAHQSLGAAQRRAGDLAGALESYRSAAELAPDSAAVHSHFAAVLAEQGSTAAALEHLERALALDPTDLELRLRLGATLASAGRYDEALPHFRAVLERAPEHVRARQLEATALVFLARDAEARQRLEDGLRRLPDAWPLVDLLARLLATSPDAAVRDGERALQLAQAALDQEATLERAETVAMALAELGRFEAAVAWQERLLEQAGTLPDAAVQSRFAASLASYRRGEPVRAPWRTDGAPPEGR